VPHTDYLPDIADSKTCARQHNMSETLFILRRDMSGAGLEFRWLNTVTGKEALRGAAIPASLIGLATCTYFNDDSARGLGNGSPRSRFSSAPSREHDIHGAINICNNLICRLTCQKLPLVDPSFYLNPINGLSGKAIQRTASMPKNSTQGLAD
jgi:hypothetical protein